MEVSNICKRDYLSDISDMSEARIIMKHTDARIPEQKVRSSNKQTFFPFQLRSYKNNQNYSVIQSIFSFVLENNTTILMKKAAKSGKWMQWEWFICCKLPMFYSKYVHNISNCHHQSDEFFWKLFSTSVIWVCKEDSDWQSNYFVKLIWGNM